MNAMNALKPPPPLPSYIFLMTGLDSKFVAARERACESACESTAINDEHIFVYRDATPDQLKPFIDNIPWKNICIVNLVPHVWPVGLLRPTSSEINVPVSASLTKVLSLIQEAA